MSTNVKVKGNYKYQWPLPNFTSGKSNNGWYTRSFLVLSTACTLSKIFLQRFTSTRLVNEQTLYDLVEDRDAEKPLITLANHHSCLDDPVIWGMLKWKNIFNTRKNRWTLTAQDICYTTKFHTTMFSLGKGIPVIRGDGVYQKGMDFAVERLKNGEWIHVYPEAKVNAEKKQLRFKWGIGRLVMECPKAPIILPICHFGMDKVLPNSTPQSYRAHFFQRVTIVIGEPIRISQYLEKLTTSGCSTEEIRKTVTDKIQQEYHKFYNISLHEHFNNKSLN